MNLLERAGFGLLNLSVKLAGRTEVKPVRSSGAPIHASSSQDGRAIFSDWTAERAINEGLKSSSWVYACADKVSTAFSSVPLVLEKRTGDTWAAQPDHDIQKLLNRPNEFMSPALIGDFWVNHMLLAGNAVWWLNIVQGKPVEMWPLMPDTVKPLQSRAQFISGYEWKADSSTKRHLEVGEVIHWMFADPGNFRWGLSPLKACASAVDLDLAAARWNRAVLANDGKPPNAVLLSDKLTVDQMKAASGLIREQVDGGNVRQALVLGGATRVQPLSLNAAELDFLNGRRFSKEEIAAVFGVPSVLLQAGEGVTYANLEASKLILWEDRVVPLLDDYARGMQVRLFPYWQLNETDWRIRADYSNVRALQGNLKVEAEVQKIRADTFKTLTDGGMPPNTAAALAGFKLDKPLPGGDQPRQQAPPGLPASKGQHLTLERKDKGDPPEATERLKRLDEWIEELRPKVAELLLEQGSAVASAYAAGQPWEQALSLDDWQMLLEALHTAVIEAEGKVAYATLLASITSSGGGGAFDVLADGVVEWIAEHTGDMVKGITDTSKAALRVEIAAGVEAGESTKDIAKRIRTLSTEWADWRADLIARTEVSNSFAAAHRLSALEIADNYGVEMTKTWVSASDSRVRPDHVQMNGETVGINENFSNGEEPGVPPNCRCVAIYREKA